MFTKMKNTMNKMSWKDWLVVSLWLLTFALLIAFVIVAATVDKGGLETESVQKHAYVVAATDAKANAHIFGLATDGSGKVTGQNAQEVVKGTDGYKGFIAGGGEVKAPNHLFIVDAIKKYNVLKKDGDDTISNAIAKTYGNVMAAVGTVFAISIFSALATTVWFKYLERKQGGKRG